ncbi:MAG: DUF835 domain-containing protein, partial [Candidatus Marinimicrobia bacterium]|nr:DUF835 domain-containing protein [Candidatus Neomarinimicrobiota bacterium]
EEPISSRDSLDALETSYLDFINKLKQVIPGQELGESSFKFWDYIEAMGMEDMVRVGAFDKLVFQSDNFKAERIKEVASNVLKVIENFEWADQLADELASLLIATYKKLQLESGHSAEEWFEKLNRDHGGFMFSTDIFAKLPDKLTPEIHPKLAEESYSVFIDNPEEAYIRLQKAAGYSIDCLCLTKYSPQKLRNKYQFDRVDIYWFSYKKTEQEKTVLPDDIPALKIFLKRNIENIAGLQLLIDCLDEIRLSHGGENTIKFISSLVETCRENQANLYIAGRLGNFTKDEVNLIQNI